jgi:hypothetical protein
MLRGYFKSLEECGGRPGTPGSWPGPHNRGSQMPRYASRIDFDPF